MGCYDIVVVPCPSCGETEYFQSKGGDCLLREYTLREAPLNVMEDVNRHSPYTCRKCATLFFVKDGNSSIWEEN